MKEYLIAILFKEPEKIEKIYGKSIIRKAKENLDQTIPQLFKKLLSRHKILSSVKSPIFGVWSTTFVIKDNLITDEQEQLKLLTQTGIKLVKEELKNEFGAATGSRIDFKLMILPVDDKDKIDDLTYLRKLSSDFPIAQLKYKDLVTEEEFKEIIKEGRLTTYLQPLISLPEEEIIGYEALTRGPEGDLFSASNLFGAADYFNLKNELELAALRQGLEWGLNLPSEKKISVNISPHLLLKEQLYDILEEEKFKGLLPQVMLELTEHLPLEAAKQLKKKIIRVEDLGVKIALDDIGCGYFDLKTVKILKPEIVKLCITVVGKIDQGDEDIKDDFSQVVKKVKEIGSLALAEGVERRKQDKLLKKFNVDLAQGYYYGRPMPASEVISNLKLR